MVVIVDPHLKRDDNYPAFKQAQELGVLVKPKSGEGEYEGWCWPGSSSWTDFFNPKSWDWWKGIFDPKEHPDKWTWTKSTTDIHIWNDMNEVGPQSRLDVVLADDRNSPLCSTVLKLRCPKTISTTVSGSIVISIT